MIPALANHLWQSTVFAAAAGLLVLAFRRNRAQVRYGLWLAASVKFLVPFSLLMELGTRVNWAPAAQAAAAQVVALPSLAPAVDFSHWVAVALIGIWACGVLAIVTVRLKAWLRVHAAARASRPVHVAAAAGLDVRSTPGRLEPGVVGVLRPVLLLPAGIVERLTPPQLEAILAHERCHVRRHDNLFAAVHMVVEALFWFYPPVWWIGAQMINERERACDESVLALGGEPHNYAGAIVSVCKFYVESPLGCVSGVSGADVRRRIEAILRNRPGQTLARAKRWLLVSAGAVALAGPAIVGLVIGLGHAPVAYAQAQIPDSKSSPRFTVVSVKPSPAGERVMANSHWQRDSGYWAVQKFPVFSVIINAYMVSFQNIPGLPAWARRADYDIEARMPPGTSDAQFRLMLQAMLADRFQMKAHMEKRPMEVALLTTAGPPGPDLHPASRSCVPSPRNPSGAFGIASASSGKQEMAGCGVTMAEVARFFTAAAVHPVVDETGLQGRYDLDVTVTLTPGFKGESENQRLQDAYAATKKAFQQQLGLSLDFSHLVKRSMPVLVIDHIAPPSAN